MGHSVVDSPMVYAVNLAAVRRGEFAIGLNLCFVLTRNFRELLLH